MELYYGALSKRDSDKRIVSGVASNEDVDAQGEIIRISAVRKALKAFMVYPALRLMHKMEAIGSVKEATITNDNLFVEAYVSDDTAWKMVKDGTLRGFSIGGKVLARDKDNSKIVTEIRLDEISLVDRPALESAKIMLHKAAGSDGVKNLPSATGRSIEAMWADLHEAKMLIDAMLDGDKKFDAMAEHQRAVEKTLAHQFSLRNEARRKLRTPDPVHRV
jgi:hypothetical protein